MVSQWNFNLKQILMLLIISYKIIDGLNKQMMGFLKGQNILTLWTERIIFIMSLMPFISFRPCIFTMPRNYQPKNLITTDRTNLEKAFYHRIETGCSIRTACDMFGVKISTLGVSLNKSKPLPSIRTCLFIHMDKNWTFNLYG